MRLFLSVDLEGITGVVKRNELLEGSYYEQARQWMTNDVLAVCEAAMDFGVTEFVIADSHYQAQNLHLDQLPSCAQLVRSWPRPLLMM